MKSFASDKDICSNLKELTDEFRNQYLERLKNTIQEGFWLMPNEEKIMGYGGAINKSYQLCTCFTDLGVNNSTNHIEKYGLMGIGVSRKFVLERDGRPLWYFLNDPTDIHADSIKELFNYLQINKTTDKKAENLYYRMSMLFDYAKPLGDNSSVLFDNYYEEREWRIVWNSKILKDFLIETYNKRPKYKMPFDNEDLQVIIFPDKKTQILFFKDNFFIDLLSKKNYNPTLISWEEYFKLLK